MTRYHTLTHHQIWPCDSTQPFFNGTVGPAESLPSLGMFQRGTWRAGVTGVVAGGRRDQRGVHPVHGGGRPRLRAGRRGSTRAALSFRLTPLCFITFIYTILVGDSRSRMTAAPSSRRGRRACAAAVDAALPRAVLLRARAARGRAPRNRHPRVRLAFSSHSGPRTRLVSTSNPPLRALGSLVIAFCGSEVQR